MAAVLRLSRGGKHKSPFYRIVATDNAKRRDGNFLEVLGTYNPLVSPPVVTLKEDRIKQWIANGALPSQTVGSIIKKRIPGLLEGRIEHQRKKIQDARRKRKAAQKGDKSSAPKAAKASKPATAKSKKA